MRTNLLAKLSNEEVNTILPVSDTNTLELVETSSQLNDALNVLEEDSTVLEDANDAIDTWTLNSADGSSQSGPVRGSDIPSRIMARIF